jgi:hypothetical protein
MLLQKKIYQSKKLSKATGSSRVMEVTYRLQKIQTMLKRYGKQINMEI